MKQFIKISRNEAPCIFADQVVLMCATSNGTEKKVSPSDVVLEYKEFRKKYPTLSSTLMLEQINEHKIMVDNGMIPALELEWVEVFELDNIG